MTTGIRKQMIVGSRMMQRIVVALSAIALFTAGNETLGAFITEGQGRPFQEFRGCGGDILRVRRPSPIFTYSSD